MSLDPRYVRGIKLFNEREFFACHDELEEVWTETLGPDREFYQGLIHTAVSLFHFEGGNLGGARKMYESSRRYLEPYGNAHLGVDLGSLRSQMDHCFRKLRGAHSSYPDGIELALEDLPTLAFTQDEL